MEAWYPNAKNATGSSGTATRSSVQEDKAVHTHEAG